MEQPELSEKCWTLETNASEQWTQLNYINCENAKKNNYNNYDNNDDYNTERRGISWTAIKRRKIVYK